MVAERLRPQSNDMRMGRQNGDTDSKRRNGTPMTRSTFGQTIARTLGLGLVIAGLAATTTLAAAAPRTIGFTDDATGPVVVAETHQIRPAQVGIIECSTGECSTDRTLAVVRSNTVAMPLVATRSGHIGLVACQSGECAGTLPTANGGWGIGFTQR